MTEQGQADDPVSRLIFMKLRVTTAVGNPSPRALETVGWDQGVASFSEGLPWRVAMICLPVVKQLAWISCVSSLLQSVGDIDASFRKQEDQDELSGTKSASKSV